MAESLISASGHVTEIIRWGTWGQRRTLESSASKRTLLEPAASMAASIAISSVMRYLHASASRNLIIISNRDPENSPEYSELLHLCGNHCCTRPRVRLGQALHRICAVGPCGTASEPPLPKATRIQRPYGMSHEKISMYRWMLAPTKCMHRAWGFQVCALLCCLHSGCVYTLANIH